MKVLIIGLGSIAYKHIFSIRALVENPIIYALRSGNKEECSTHKNVINIFNLGDVDMADVDFVIISNPTAMHYQTIVQLLPYRIPLFIEKPLFSNISLNNEKLIDQINDFSIPTYIACNLRFLDCLNEIKSLLIDERINEVNVYCGSYLPDWRPGADFRKVYSANKELGGGVHIDLIHELDYIYWIFGNPQNIQSYFSNRSSLDITAVDYANYLWQYEMYAVNIVLNYYRRDAKRTLEVVTENNIYLVDLLSNSITKNGNQIFKSEQKVIDTYIPQMKHFFDVIISKNKSINTIEEANRILELCIKG